MVSAWALYRLSDDEIRLLGAYRAAAEIAAAAGTPGWAGLRAAYRTAFGEPGVNALPEVVRLLDASEARITAAPPAESGAARAAELATWEPRTLALMREQPARWDRLHRAGLPADAAAWRDLATEPRYHTAALRKYPDEVRRDFTRTLQAARRELARGWRRTTGVPRRYLSVDRTRLLRVEPVTGPLTTNPYWDDARNSHVLPEEVEARLGENRSVALLVGNGWMRGLRLPLVSSGDTGAIVYLKHRDVTGVRQFGIAFARDRWRIRLSAETDRVLSSL
ncbi:hypothetical protein [Actinoplanes sp. NPDC051851]|uniref:hypothetical protein n=1 Tax=Actinoplanes sp. NPDC051851 TaxID=3154753 RepID=UPI003444F32D